MGAALKLASCSLVFPPACSASMTRLCSLHGRLQGMDIMFIHDMLVTEHWYIIIMGPMQVGAWTG